MRRLVIVLIALLPACAVSKEKRCQRFADMGLQMVMGIANGVADGLAGGKDVPDVKLPAAATALARAKAVEECMSWPDDFVRCITDGDWESAECQEAYARKEGIVVPVDGRAGPAPATRSIDHDDMLECAGGRCVLETAAAGLERVGDGKSLATGSFVGVTTLQGAPALIAAKDGEVEVIIGDKTTKIAAPRPAPDDPFARPLAVSEGGLVLFDDARVRRLAVPPCEQCFAPTPWQVEGEPSDVSNAELHELPGGALLYYDDGSHLVVYGADGARRFRLDARDQIGSPLVAGDVVYVGVGAEGLALDAARCQSAEAVSSAELAAPCLEARIPLAATAEGRPARLGANVYFLADGRVHQMIDGAKGWVAEVEGESLLAVERAGVRMLLAASHWTMDHPARLVAIDPESGKRLVQVDLASQLQLGSVAVARDGDRIVVQTANRLFSWDIDALAKAIAD